LGCREGQLWQIFATFAAAAKWFFYDFTLKIATKRWYDIFFLFVN